MSATSPVEVVPAEHAKLALEFTHTGGIASSSITLGLHLLDVSLSDLQMAVDEVQAAWAAQMDGAQSNEWALTHVIGRGSPDDGGLVAENHTIAPGLVTDPPAPANCSVLVEKNTSLAGRGNHGRMFIPGFIADSKVDGSGNIDGTQLASLNTAVTAFRTDILSSLVIGNIVVFHSDYVRDPAVAYDKTIVNQAMIANPLADTPASVTSFSVDPKIATQRRRLR